MSCLALLLPHPSVCIISQGNSIPFLLDTLAGSSEGDLVDISAGTLLACLASRGVGSVGLVHPADQCAVGVCSGCLSRQTLVSRRS
jgi:hypothetical protein